MVAVFPQSGTQGSLLLSCSLLSSLHLSCSLLSSSHLPLSCSLLPSLLSFLLSLSSVSTAPSPPVYLSPPLFSPFLFTHQSLCFRPSSPRHGVSPQTSLLFVCSPCGWSLHLSHTHRRTGRRERRCDITSCPLLRRAGVQEPGGQWCQTHTVSTTGL